MACDRDCWFVEIAQLLSSRGLGLELADLARKWLWLEPPPGITLAKDLKLLFNGTFVYQHLSSLPDGFLPVLFTMALTENTSALGTH
jgi:hypothetical protein